MASLIIPVAVLMLLSLWGVWSSGRKFRREFLRRGKSWEAVCAEIQQGQGLLIVDTIFGPQRGLGHPVIWWLPAMPAGNDLASQIETEGGAALLVRCPRSLRNLEALRSRFGDRHVASHSWAIAATSQSSNA